MYYTMLYVGPLPKAQHDIMAPGTTWSLQGIMKQI